MCACRGCFSCGCTASPSCCLRLLGSTRSRAGSRAPGGTGAPPGQHCQGVVPRGEGKLLSWGEGSCHQSTTEGLFFLGNLAAVTSVNSRPVRILYRHSGHRTITSAPHKRRPRTHVLLHLPKHHSHAIRNLCSGSSRDPTGERACESALEMLNARLECSPSPVAS